MVRIPAAVSIACLALAAGGSAIASGPAVSTAITPRVIADHLDNPRGLFVDAQGALWVAEAGRGGTRCVFSGELCYGRTGVILRITRDRIRPFARRLASIRERGFGTVGADDVSVSPNGTVFTAMITDNGSLPSRIRKRALGGQLGALLRFSRRGHAIRQAAVGLRSVGVLIGHPYGVLALPGRELIVDSELNRLVEVRGRRARVIFRFPPGAHRADSVPTSLARGPDGAIYIGELSGFGAGQGGARIWRMAPGQRPKPFATGFSAIVGLGFGPDGSLYVCEFSRNFDANDPHGDIVKIAPNGSRTRLGVGQLFHPGGVAVGRNGTVYVSNWSTLTGKANRAGHRGQLVAITG